MKKIKALTFKEKEDTIRLVFKQYHRACLKLKCLRAKSFYPQIEYGVVKEKKASYGNSMISRLDSYIDTKDELISIIETFEIIMSSLSPETKFIITKEFVEGETGDWWVDFYSRSTYYRVKTRAMEEMLFYLNI